GLLRIPTAAPPACGEIKILLPHERGLRCRQDRERLSDVCHVLEQLRTTPVRRRPWTPGGPIDGTRLTSLLTSSMDQQRREADHFYIHWAGEEVPRRDSMRGPDCSTAMPFLPRFSPPVACPLGILRDGEFSL
ncbi:MAG: hypothetical protein BJ554DRAFT_6952, partial [Olpidium bornovanus]